MSELRTYLDHNATAPLREEARLAMIGALDFCGNPSSVHFEGREARALIETAREKVAGYLGVRSREIVFTSGATESNNWVIGAGWAALVVSAVEHESVLAPAAQVACPSHTIGVDAHGVVDLGALEETLWSLCALPVVSDENSVGAKDRSRTVVVSIQVGNGETGVVQPLGDVRAVLGRFNGLDGDGERVDHDWRALLHVDAVQYRACHRDLLGEARADFISVSAHKIGGPKGIGALFVRDGVSIDAMMLGGGQELRARSGTQNVAGIAGFGACAQVAGSDAEVSRCRELLVLRDEIERAVCEISPDTFIVGAGSDRLCNTSCICVRGVRAETLVMGLDLEGVGVSAGSACSSGKVSVSHVLKGMGIAQSEAECAVRVSLGWTSTIADVDRFLAAFEVVTKRVFARREVAGDRLRQSA